MSKEIWAGKKIKGFVPVYSVKPGTESKVARERYGDIIGHLKIYGLMPPDSPISQLLGELEFNKSYVKGLEAKPNPHLKIASTISNDGYMYLNCGVYASKERVIRLGAIDVYGDVYGHEDCLCCSFLGRALFHSNKDRIATDCHYYSGINELKCAVNPTGSCFDCVHYRQMERAEQRMLGVRIRASDLLE